MDLREFNPTASQLKQATALVASGAFRYQPFIFSDRLEIGTGQCLHDGYRDGQGLFDFDYFADPSAGIDKGAPAVDLTIFRQRNSEYRAMYELAADAILEAAGGSLTGKTVGEIGASTGLHLYNLRRRGAARCVAYEKNDIRAIYPLLNEITGLTVDLKLGFYLNLEHRFWPEDPIEHDVMVSSHVLNHMSDPLHHLAYICDHAREVVFIWTHVDRKAEDFQITLPYQTRFKGDPFPLNLNAHVVLSEKGLAHALASLGFEDMRHVPIPVTSPGWATFLGKFHMYVAKRTRSIKSALTGEYRRILIQSMQSHLASMGIATE